MSQKCFRWLSVILLFAFCQIVGVMCATGDLALAEEGAVLAEEMMVCPMDGRLMCPPSMISSADPKIKHGGVLAVDEPLSISHIVVCEDVLTIKALVGADSSPPDRCPLCVSLPVLRI